MFRPAAVVLGRERELVAVGSFLSAVGGPSTSLVLEGPAGIGKSAIWAEAVTRARSEGLIIRTCRCAAADAAWAFSGLGDLLEGIPDGVLAFPDGRRVAVELDRRSKSRTVRITLIRNYLLADFSTVWWYCTTERLAAGMQSLVEEQYAAHLIHVGVVPR